MLAFPKYGATIDAIEKGVKLLGLIREATVIVEDIPASLATSLFMGHPDWHLIGRSLGRERWWKFGGKSGDQPII